MALLLVGLGRRAAEVAAVLAVDRPPKSASPAARVLWEQVPGVQIAPHWLLKARCAGQPPGPPSRFSLYVTAIAEKLVLSASSRPASICFHIGRGVYLEVMQIFKRGA